MDALLLNVHLNQVLKSDKLIAQQHLVNSTQLNSCQQVVNLMGSGENVTR